MGNVAMSTLLACYYGSCDVWLDAQALDVWLRLNPLRHGMAYEILHLYRLQLYRTAQPRIMHVNL